MTVVIPGSARPSNLHVPAEDLSLDIEGDVYHIADRMMEEFGPSVFLVLHRRHTNPYVVMERALDGTEMFVWRFQELDNRVIEKLRYMRGVPLADRLAAVEKEEAKHAEEQKAQELDEMYERMGGPMYRQLHHDGFAHGARSTNYPLVPGKRR